MYEQVARDVEIKWMLSEQVIGDLRSQVTLRSHLCDSSMGDHCVSTVQFSFKVVVDMLGCHFFHTLIVCFETHPNTSSLVSPQRCPQCRQAESLLVRCAYSLCVLRR